MTAIDIGVVVTLFGAVLASYVTLSERMKKTEGCVGNELKHFTEALNKFREQVIDRLARIETKLEIEEKGDALRSE